MDITIAFKMKKILYNSLIILSLFSCHQDDEVIPEEVGALEKRAESRLGFYSDLAFHHAPINYQDVDRTGSHGLRGKADYITAYDFDGDLNAKNNWRNMTSSSYKKNAVVYYSVVETNTHFFITYAFFHARDWTDIWFLYGIDEHENDLEGVLAIVEKDGSEYGNALGIVTVFHSDFFSFKTPGSELRNGNQDIDGTLTSKEHNGVQRFETAAQAKGHGIKALSKLKPGGNDYVVYYPSKTRSEEPSDIYDRKVHYTLINIFETGGMWEQRFNELLFKNARSFQKSYGQGIANAPWNWNDKDDGGGTGLYAGGMAYYPAHLVDNYFNGLGSFSKTYTYNPFLNITQ